MSKPKVAICLRGMLRTGIHNKKTFEHWFESIFDVDYFYHFWDVENGAIPNSIGVSTYDNTKILKMLKARKDWEVLHTKKEKFKKVYKPVRGKFEGLKQNKLLRKKYNNIVENNYWEMTLHPQFISAFEVDKLRRQYEVENNFKYDLVINTRADLVIRTVSDCDVINSLKSFIKNSKNVGIVNIPRFASKDLEVADDVFYAGNSDVMKIFLNHFDHNVNKKSHQFVIKYLLEKNIVPKNIPFQYCILRDFNTYLDPIEDFEDIFIDDHRIIYGKVDLNNFPRLSSIYKEVKRRIKYELL